MPSSLNGTGVTFNDGTTLNSANDAGGNYIQRTYTSPATWTKPTGLKAVKVTVTGGGGGGGRASPDTPGFGGGGGGTAVRYVPAPSIPGPVAVTIGAGGTGIPAPSPVPTRAPAGGTSSFGAFASATGGEGAGFAAPSLSLGGVGSSGDLNLNGGTRGSNSTFGGASFFGVQAVVDENGQVYGGGAGGRSITPNLAGRNGAAGVVIVEEFY
jgi:hypothetical protein